MLPLANSFREPYLSAQKELNNNLGYLDYLLLVKRSFPVSFKHLEMPCGPESAYERIYIFENAKMLKQ